MKLLYKMVEDLGSGNWETVSAKKIAARYLASVLSMFDAPIWLQR